MIRLKDIEVIVETVIASNEQGRKLIAETHIVVAPFVSFYIEDHCEVIYQTTDINEAISKFNS